MKLDEIRDKWTLKNNNFDAVREMWDSQAESQCYNQIPSFEDNQFLQLMERKGMLDPSYDVLDIGCGVGTYSIAIADRVKTATGVDISPRMIEHGNHKVKELDIKNINLRLENWSEFSLKENGFYHHFDLVFAHMTPAVSSASSLEKMIEASKRFCILSKPTRRNDPVYFEIEKLMGIRQAEHLYDNEIINIFSLLWQLGYSPKMYYENQIWNTKRTYEEACVFYINKIKVKKKLTDDDIHKVNNYLMSIAENGMIMECITTLITTIFWEKCV